LPDLAFAHPRRRCSDFVAVGRYLVTMQIATLII
jgi:hypothetical protein